MSHPLVSSSHRRGALSACALGLMILLNHSTAAHAAGPLRVLGLDVSQTMGGRDVRIHTDGTPSYTVFKLNDPMRVVLDVAGGDISAIRGPLHYEDGIIGHIAVRQYPSDTAPIGRIIVSFDGEAGYDVRTDGADIVLHAQRPVHEGPTAPPDVAPIAQAPKASLKEPVDSAPVAVIPTQQPTANAQQAMPSSPQRRNTETVAALAEPLPPATEAHTPEIPRGPNAKLARIEHHDEGVLLRVSPIPQYTTHLLTNPARLVLDLHHTQKRASLVRGQKKPRGPIRCAWPSTLKRCVWCSILRPTKPHR